MHGTLARRAAGFYRERVLPPLIERVMRAPDLVPYRSEVVPQAGGRVLEIGIGSALNLPFYGRATHQLVGLDPSARLLAIAQRRLAAAACPVSLLQADAENIPLDDASMDAVVTTWSLCSVADVAQALAEVHRVLRRGGTLIFVEHGLAPDAQVRRWQHRLAPAWAVIGGGCRLDRSMADLIQQAGFRIQSLQTGYMRGPKPMTFLYRGLAQRQ